MAQRILIVDDDPDILVLTTARLRPLGYEIITAIDAEQALVFLQKESVDLIILDRLLPKMQGEELCKMLKSDVKFKNIPIILFTALVCDIAGIIKESGADDCITKPYDPKELINKVKNYLEIKK
jgi:DNA-binding response OmpR family regulator